MTENEIPVVKGQLLCPDGRSVSPDICRFCLHSRYFIIRGVRMRSPALAFCLRERVVENPDTGAAEAVGCAAKKGCGYSNIGNIIS